MPASDAQTGPALSSDFRREAFKNEFADNVFFEPTAWDLKLVFGQVDTHLGPNTVVQHTGITLPWSQAKVLLYFLELHVAAHELTNGRMLIPQGLIPELPIPDKEMLDQDPNVMRMYRTLSKVRERFIANNPEAEAPKKK